MAWIRIIGTAVVLFLAAQVHCTSLLTSEVTLSKIDTVFVDNAICMRRGVMCGQRNGTLTTTRCCEIRDGTSGKLLERKCCNQKLSLVIAAIAGGSLLLSICILTCCICGWTYYFDKKTACCRRLKNLKHKYKPQKRKTTSTPFQKPLERTEQPPSYTSVFPELTTPPSPQLTEKEDELEKIEMAVPLTEEDKDDVMKVDNVADVYKWSTTV